MARRPSAWIQRGAREAYIIALTYSRVSPVFSSLTMSRPLSCDSLSAKRTVTLPSSSSTLVKATPAFLRVDSMVASCVAVDGGAILARDLQREVVAEQVRQGEQQRHRQHRGDEDVFPARVLEHVRPSGSLERALRHQRGDLETLDLDAHAVGDFNA